MLPANPFEKHNLGEYLNVYAAEIIDKHDKYSNYHRKYRKMEKMLQNTQYLLQSLQENFKSLEIKPEDLMNELKTENEENLLRNRIGF